MARVKKLSQERKDFIDTFINKVYLWEDKITILYNVQDAYSDITLDDIKKEDLKANFDESSLLGRLVEARSRKLISQTIRCLDGMSRVDSIFHTLKPLICKYLLYFLTD